MAPPTGGARTVGQGLAVIVGYGVARRAGRRARQVAAYVPKSVAEGRHLAEYLRSESVRRGVLLGRPGWLGLAAVLWGARAVRRSQRRSEQILLAEVLAPGERVVVHEQRTRGRRARRAARS